MMLINPNDSVQRKIDTLNRIHEINLDPRITMDEAYHLNFLRWLGGEGRFDDDGGIVKEITPTECGEVK